MTALCLQNSTIFFFFFWIYCWQLISLQTGCCTDLWMQTSSCPSVSCWHPRHFCSPCGVSDSNYQHWVRSSATQFDEMQLQICKEPPPCFIEHLKLLELKKKYKYNNNHLSLYLWIFSVVQVFIIISKAVFNVGNWTHLK